MKVNVIIPAYNEEKNIEATLCALKTLKWEKNIIVIDDGSVDDTANIATGHGIKTIRHIINKGKMAAVIRGLKEVEEGWVMLLDADLGESASEAGKLLPPLFNNNADMTIATFPKFRNNGLGIVKRRAQRIVLKKTGTTLHSPLSGQRAFHSNWISLLSSNENGKGYGLELYLNLQFLANGARIEEVATNMQHRVTGKNIKGFYHRAKQWMEMEYTLWNY